MEKAKLMQLEIEEKRKLPKNVKDEIVVKIFHTLIVAIIIIIYFLTVNLFFYNFEAKMFEECMKYYALIIIIATVTVFEIGYRKNSMKFAVIGVELLACGILSLYKNISQLNSENYAELPELLRNYVDFVKPYLDNNQYPGSPEIIRKFLRSGDKEFLFELHNTEIEILKSNIKDSRVTILHQNSFENPLR